MKNVLLPSVLFEDLGLRYYGPIDGHDTALLIRTFEFLKTQDEPVILHILTKEGQGLPARAQAAGQVPRPRQVQARNRRNRRRPAADVLGNCWAIPRSANFADNNSKIVTITGAMPTGTGLIRFQKRHPQKYL